MDVNYLFNFNSSPLAPPPPPRTGVEVRDGGGPWPWVLGWTRPAPDEAEEGEQVRPGEEAEEGEQVHGERACAGRWERSSRRTCCGCWRVGVQSFIIFREREGGREGEMRKLMSGWAAWRLGLGRARLLSSLPMTARRAALAVVGSGPGLVPSRRHRLLHQEFLFSIIRGGTGGSKPVESSCFFSIIRVWFVQNFSLSLQ